MKRSEIKNNDSLSLKGRGIQSGRSMIEMLGVLAIIGVLSVGGIAGYSKAMTKYRINKTIEQITLIAGNVRTFFAPQGNYAGLDSSSDTGKAIIKKAKLVPDEMWEGERIVGSLGHVNLMKFTNKYFQIDINVVDEEECIELATKDWSSVESGISSLVIYDSGEAGTIDDYESDDGSFDNCDGSVWDDTILACTNGKILSFPIPLNIAVDICGDNYESHDFVFIFR
ncbi:MAG: hypothetical protein IJ525_02140 [Alphaproteobacteria bacterium]|nr:hypothetical protein [Alphaproteobacteria bacterium]